MTKAQAESEFKRDAPLSSEEYRKNCTTVETGPGGEQRETVAEHTV